MSPDGKRIVLDVDNANANIWVWDAERGDLSRMTFRGSNNNPSWTPDGGSIVYASSRGGRTAIYRQPADGGSEAERLTPLDTPAGDATVSGDGRYLAYLRPDRVDIWMRRIDQDDDCRPLLASGFAEWAPRLSPDGRWLAYCSDESGHEELYVRPFPEGEGRWKVSTGGADEGAWSPDGSSLLWISDERDMMEATFAAAGRDVQIGRPRSLFSAEPYWDRLSVTPDGDLLLIRSEPGSWMPDHLVVVVNWFEELTRLVPR
jgi:Tol biopolymer transport system component